ncbi:MAG TPA: flagellar motor switch protein FliG [Arenimonas sp.]|nr:flagellar motor switch protein FliG [Arenimonas sp.]
MTGTQRAAVLLMSLGEKDAAEVLKQLGAKDVQKLGVAMATISNVSRDQAENVLDDFVNTLENQTSLGVGADDYVRSVLIGALGEDKASGLIDRILHGRNTKGLETLKWMDAKSIAELVRNEHPQIIAIVLSHLDSDQAAEVLKFLQDRVRADVILRIASLEGIPPNALNELNDIMEKQFSGNQNVKSSSVGGLKCAADIMNFLETAQEQAVMTMVRQIDAAIGDKIQELMFVFDDLIELDDRSMQALLRDVPNDKLGVALRGADSAVKDKITKNMSQRAAAILVEDMEARGPVRLADVEAAQREILNIVRQLADAGTIQLGGKSEEFL